MRHVHPMISSERCRTRKRGAHDISWLAELKNSSPPSRLHRQLQYRTAHDYHHPRSVAGRRAYLLGVQPDRLRARVGVSAWPWKSCRGGSPLTMSREIWRGDRCLKNSSPPSRRLRLPTTIYAALRDAWTRALPMPCRARQLAARADRALSAGNLSGATRRGAGISAT